MMGYRGRVYCEDCQWMHHPIGPLACKTNYSVKLLYRIPRRVLRGGAFEDSRLRYWLHRKNWIHYWGA
jgi:hypothetical protein